MKKGFDNSDVKGFLNLNEVNNITKEYKKIKKYMKTSYYQLQMLNGTEKIVNGLMNKYYKEE
jgi:hypothetical protein